MGRQGREALTLETTESQNISFRREKGCFLNSCTILLLGVLFLAAIIATGVLVYFFTDKPSSLEESSPVKYEVVPHQRDSARANPIPDDTHMDGGGEGPSEKIKPKGKEEVKEKGEKEVMMEKKKINVRLPRNVIPLHYYVRLIPYVNGNFSIDGHVEMTFEVLEMTQNVTLHINAMVTKNETIKIVPESEPDGKGVDIKAHLYDKEREFYIADLKQKLEKGKRYIIKMDFVGYLNDDLDGFYRSSYKDETGQTRWLAATQFQPTDARKAFPCMDEPGPKASYTIELGREGNMSSLSNMPLKETVPMKDNRGWFWDKFEKSVAMSTYLVAFVVSDFKYKESPDQMKYKFRVWSRESALPQADYALEIGPPASRFFEEFFNISYPLPKQDMIALPDFSAGAMENWGLITYRETAMLYDPTATKASDKLSLTTTIVHEIAHQWFGNLVTPSWWTDLWLNEGFASYMEFIGTHAVQPTWKMMEMVVVVDLQRVFNLDCLESSHPISIPVGHPDEINEIFDRISYLKGSSIIRMMSNFLTEGTFRRGLTQYLSGLAYKSAEQDDLWRYLTMQGHKDGTLAHDMTVKTIMDTWTLQMGFPVITVTKNNDGTATLKQERFLLIRNESSNKTHDYKWWVPITYTTHISPDFSTTNPKIWMKPSEATKVVEGIPSDGWVIFNNQETGYYRVNYDKENWQLITDQLLKDHQVISTINRAQIIDDSMSLARAGLLPYETAFKVLSYLKNENEYVPWKAALSSLAFIRKMFTHTGGYGALKEFYLSIILPMYDKLGFNDSVTDPHLDQMMRELILSTACLLGHRPCVEESVKLFKMWMQNPNDYSLFSPNLKSFVYCTAIREGGYEEWKFAWNRYENANVASEKRTIIKALGCTKESWILNGYMDRAISSKKGIRKQDAGSVIASIARSANGRSVAWGFLKDKWSDIQSYYGSAAFTLGYILKACTNSLNTRNHIYELKQFVQMNEGKFGSAERSAKQATENAQNNRNWMNDNYQKILSWLSENGYENSI